MTRAHRIYPENRVVIREVGLRDGLQLTDSYPSTDAKAEWIASEYAAGLRHFEVGSFLPVARAPQFADVKRVIDVVARHDGAHGVALALNERGTIDALTTEVGEITMVVSASATHNEANARRTRTQSLEEMAKAVRQRDESGSDTIINAGIAMAFGCSFEGVVSEDAVLRLVDRCLEAGADMVGLADTVGFAGPRQVGALCARMTGQLGSVPYVIHLHDTRGMAIANAAAALDAGCRVLDGALGGLGGCPFAPGATGNVVIEDLIFLTETKGFATGIDLGQLMAAREILGREMPHETLHGQLAQAGPPPDPVWRAASDA